MSEEIKKVKKEKNPNSVAAGKKSYETHMIKLKEDILLSSKTSNTSNTPSDTSNATPSTSNATPSTSNATKSSSSYVAHMYGVGILSILAVGLCVFYYYSNDKGEKKKKDSTATTTTVSTKENIIHRRKML